MIHAPGGRGYSRKENLAHYFPYDVTPGLLAHSRSFLANQKARNAIVGAENLLNRYMQHQRVGFSAVLVKNRVSI